MARKRRGGGEEKEGKEGGWEGERGKERWRVGRGEREEGKVGGWTRDREGGR